MRSSVTARGITNHLTDHLTLYLAGLYTGTVGDHWVKVSSRLQDQTQMSLINARIVYGQPDDVEIYELGVDFIDMSVWLMLIGYR